MHTCKKQILIWGLQRSRVCYDLGSLNQCGKRGGGQCMSCLSLSRLFLSLSLYFSLSLSLSLFRSQSVCLALPGSMLSDPVREARRQVQHVHWVSTESLYPRRAYTLGARDSQTDAWWLTQCGMRGGRYSMSPGSNTHSSSFLNSSAPRGSRLYFSRSLTACLPPSLPISLRLSLSHRRARARSLSFSRARVRALSLFISVLAPAATPHPF